MYEKRHAHLIYIFALLSTGGPILPIPMNVLLYVCQQMLNRRAINMLLFVVIIYYHRIVK